jgi:hypothetical protein
MLRSDVRSHGVGNFGRDFDVTLGHEPTVP